MKRADKSITRLRTSNQHEHTLASLICHFSQVVYSAYQQGLEVRDVEIGDGFNGTWKFP